MFGMMRRRFLSRSQIVSLLAIILVPAVLIFAGFQLRLEFKRNAETEARVYDSFVTRSQIQRVFSLLLDSETGQRGFVITGQDEFKKPFEVASEKLGPQFEMLSSLIDQSPEQRADFEKLKRLAEAVQETHRRIVAVKGTGAPSGAADIIASGVGQRPMDQVRAVVDQMILREANTLAIRTHAAHARTQRTKALVSILFVALSALLLTTAFWLWRHARSREKLLNDLRAVSARQQAVFDGAIDGIITLNPSGSIESVNMAAERMFGFSGDELQRRDVSKLVEIGGAADRSFLDRIGASKGALNTGMVRQLTARRRDGQSFPVDVAFGPIELATGTHVVAVLRDVSERHRLDEMKSDFIATVSHELRTPLTSIVGALSLLASNSAGDLPSRAAKLVEIAHRNGQRLVRLINDVLSIQKIESGKFELDFGHVTLKDVAERSIEGISAMAYDLGVSIELIAEDDAPVYADDERLIQVVTNLLSNACRYSTQGGTVTITVRRLRHFVRLSVRDRGPGIPIEFRSSIFSKFSQADDVRSKSGTGLGLIIAREITEMNGGSLWFESEPGDGATFHVDLPLAVSRAGDGTEAPRVLVCEDNPARAESLAQSLDQDGFSVDVARTIEAGIQLASEGDYAAALIDLNLAECNSMELIDALRSHSNTRHLPVILLGGDTTKVGSADGPLVVVDWLAEPMDLERLRAAVATSLATNCGQVLVLHVEDDPDILELARTTLAGVAKVIPAPSLASARIELARARPDIVILDLNLADGSGPDLLADLSDRKGRNIPVVIYSARDISPELAARVDAVLMKSKTSMDGLSLTVRRLIAKQEAIRHAAA